jgi:quinol monooxygenase YgiN
VSTEPEIALLTAQFDAKEGQESALSAVLARYVVLTRQVPHCRNVDLVTSTARPGRFLVVEKWEGDDEARAHLDTELMAGMARDAVPLLEHQPTLDLYETISAHDLH